jgi:L-fuculose-phosphate aldolase
VRSDVDSIVHLHPLISTTLATINEPITPVTSEELFFIGDKIGIVSLLPAGSSSLQEAVLEQAKECNVIILKNHGCVALGKSLKEAFYRVIKLERAAQATVIAKIFGKKIDPFTLLG